MLSNLKGLLTNKMPFVQRQHQKHVENVETNDDKASLPEQINHCDKRPSTHAYTGTSVDRCQDYRK